MLKLKDLAVTDPKAYQNTINRIRNIEVQTPNGEYVLKKLENITIRVWGDNANDTYERFLEAVSCEKAS
jgi:hypothetical protein